MSKSKLIRWAGLSTILAGVLFIFIQIIHPKDTLQAVSSSNWAIVHYLTIAMAVLGMLGITGVYAKQVKESGWLGFIGFIMLYLWLAVTMNFTFIEAFILPPLVTQAPLYVEGVLDFANSQVSLGALEILRPLSGPFYIFGGLIFGIATIRAGVLPRWGALLLAFGTMSALSVPLLPYGWGRFTVVPVGLGLIWLGYALWSQTSSSTKALTAEKSRLVTTK